MRQADSAKSAETKQRTVASPIDPQAVMRIKNLQLRAKTIVHGFFSGLHRSPTHGSSVEFSEYRPYSVGDDLRSLDWKRYARTDRYFVKKFEDETNRRCYLVFDQSRSMSYGSIEYTKIDYARTLAATFAHFLMLQRDGVGLLTFDEKLGDFLPARNRTGQLTRLLAALSRRPEGKATDLEGPLQHILSLAGRRALVLMISDLLSPIESLQHNLGALRSCGHEVTILRVLDPAEIEFELSSPSMVVDMETRSQIFLDPDVARQQYRDAFDNHQSELVSMCKTLGIDLHTMPTDRPLAEAMFYLLNARGRISGKRSQRSYLDNRIREQTTNSKEVQS